MFTYYSNEITQKIFVFCVELNFLGVSVDLVAANC